MEPYKTSDFDVASTLMASGMEVTLKKEGAVTYAHFDYTKDLNDLIFNYHQRNVQVDAFTLYEKRRFLNSFNAKNKRRFLNSFNAKNK